MMARCKMPLAAGLWFAMIATGLLAQGPPPGRGPGARGRAARDGVFRADMTTIHALLGAHDKVTRHVKQLDNGVETTTESADADVAKWIQEHAAAMKKRLEKPDPIRMRDPLFAELFRHADKIKLTIRETEHGVVVRETSDDEHTVKLIQEHAKVVSQFVAKGHAEARLNHAPPE